MFEDHRQQLLSLAYRMLGSAGEAEDVVQDAWLRLNKVDVSTIESEKAWLSTVVTRLCLDRIKSWQSRRESYVGPWLPEPVLTNETVDPEAISMAFLVLLERLTPHERATYLLHEVFEYTHAEVANVLKKEETACRQLFHRAQQRIQEGRPRFAPTRAAHERLLRAFADAMMRADLKNLEEVLATDATLWADGGGNVPHASRRPVHGAHAIAVFLSTLVRKFPPASDQTFEVLEVNGWPALVGRSAGEVNVVMTIETDGNTIFALRDVVNPEKLKRFSADATSR